MEICIILKQSPKLIRERKGVKKRRKKATKCMERSDLSQYVDTHVKKKVCSMHCEVLRVVSLESRQGIFLKITKCTSPGRDVLSFCPTERLEWFTNWRPLRYPKCWMHLHHRLDGQFPDSQQQELPSWTHWSPWHPSTRPGRGLGAVWGQC